MSQDSTLKTIQVAVGICLVCSLFVSVAAVKLAPKQLENKQVDKIQNILAVADLSTDKNEHPIDIFEKNIEKILVELDTGKIIPEDQIPAAKLQHDNFDIKNVSDDQEYGMAIPEDQDMAGIKRRPKYMWVYEVVKNGETEKIIMPIYGKGLWSTLYGFISLEKDLKTVGGITFYEHGETPGLGGEIDNPRWKASWHGKQALDDDLSVIIHVIKGQVTPGTPAADREIDGLSGATLTTRGVDNLIQYWLGDNGYGPFLKKLKEEL